MAEDDSVAARYESEHVHDVYDQIASHFSSTRYKPWPIVEQFLQRLPPGSVGLDVGCGNGKYLAVNHDIFIVASDRSQNLVQIAKTHDPHAAVLADILHLPHPYGTFDFAISIAVVHHLATPARRVAAIASLLLVLRPTIDSKSKECAGEQHDASEKVEAQALIYVWALEQKNSRRGWDAGDDQDVMVPWVLKSQQKLGRPHLASATKTILGAAANEFPGVQGREMAAHGSGAGSDRVFHRYYHLYRAGELEEDIRQAGGRVLDSGYEHDNWWAIACRGHG